MPPRTFETIQLEMKSITRAHNTQRMPDLVAELVALGTPQALALSETGKGQVECWANNFTKALEHFERASTLYSTMNDALGEANQILSIGTVHFLMQEYSSAIEHFEVALRVYTEHDAQNDVGTALANLGTAYGAQGKYEDAIKHYTKAIELHSNHNNVVMLCRTYGNIGNAYRALANFDLSLENYNKAIELHRQMNDVVGLANTTRTLAGLFDTYGLYPRAIELLQESHALYEQTNNTLGIGRVYENIGTVFHHAQELKRSEEYFEKAVEIQQRTNDKAGLAITITNMVSILHENGNDGRALEQLPIALKIYQDARDLEGVARVLASMSGLYTDAGQLDTAVELVNQLDAMHIISFETQVFHNYNKAKLRSANGEFASAKKCYLHALEIADKYDLRNYQPNIYLGLRNVAMEENNLKDYVTYNDAFMRLTESMRGQDTTRKLAAIEAEKRVEAERVEKEKHRALLYNALPPHIADRVLRGEVVNDNYEATSVLFLDIVGFTNVSAAISPTQVTEMLDAIFKICDEACLANRVTRIKTIGDAYMAVSF